MAIEDAPQLNNPESNEIKERKERINLKILVADDYSSIIGLLEVILGEKYSLVKCVENGKLLVDNFLDPSQKFDFIITDNNMPEMTGIEAIRKIRETNKTVPIIMMTGDMDIRNLQQETDKLNFICLSKPVNSRKLVEKIEEMRLKQK